MVLKLLPVGLMVCGIAMATSSASAQCQSNAPPGPEPNWNGPSSYQPGPGQRPMAPPPAPQPPGQKPAQGAMNQPAPIQQGQTAQNIQPYQSFSAEPQAVQTAPMYAPNTYSYPTYGGYYGNGYNGGYYSYPSYGGGWNSGLDNARFHGVNPNAYP